MIDVNRRFSVVGLLEVKVILRDGESFKICGLEASFPGPIVIFLLRSRNIIDICD
jgi:hypothetical protein